MPDTLTMQQVADLAGVRRAVVSMWRSRYPTTEGGFPAPVDARSLTFSADAVGEWLTRTGRGNNPDAAVDAALHSSRFATIREHLDAASGLLLLQALTGELLADLDAETALDAILDAQLPALLPPRETLAALDDAALVADVDTLAEAGYGGERVLWRLVAAEHARGGAFAEHSLTVDAAAMFTSLLRAVATADHHVVLHGQGALALLTQVAADIPADGTSSLGQGTMPLNAGLSVREKGVEVAPGRASAASRLALRAFAARGIETTGTDAGDNLHVIVENRADAHAAITLFEKVRAVSHDLADRDVALVLAPADLLVGTLGEGSNLDEARRECFNISQAQRAVSRHRQEQRAGLAPDYTLPLRYVATLPKGMLRATGRRRLALWALAPNTDDTRPAFTTYGDHANHALDPGECDALAADVAAACSGDRATHAFLRARHRATYNLLDESSLVIPPGVREPRDGGEVLAQAWVTRAAPARRWRPRSTSSPRGWLPPRRPRPGLTSSARGRVCVGATACRTRSPRRREARSSTSSVLTRCGACARSVRGAWIVSRSSVSCRRCATPNLGMLCSSPSNGRPRSSTSGVDASCRRRHASCDLEVARPTVCA